MEGMLIKYLKEYNTLKRSRDADEDSLLDYCHCGAEEESYPSEEEQAKYRRLSSR